MARSTPEENWIWSIITTTCSNVTEVAQLGTLSWRYGQWRQSYGQPATDNGVRDGIDKIDWSLSRPHGQYPPSASCTVQIGAASARNLPCNHQHARQLRFLCGHSGHNNALKSNLHKSSDIDAYSLCHSSRWWPSTAGLPAPTARRDRGWFRDGSHAFRITNSISYRAYT